MTVNIICEKPAGFSFHYRALAQKVIAQALDCEKFPYEAEINLILTDNEGIRQANRELRGIDAPTDVLSFPMLAFPAPADYSGIETEWEGCVNPDTGEVILGDMILSCEKVRSQAREYGHSEKREYAFLITHSMLHLTGYDHMEEEEARRMEERQRMILNSLHIKRESQPKKVSENL